MFFSLKVCVINSTYIVIIQNQKVRHNYFDSSTKNHQIRDLTIVKITTNN